MARRAVTFAEDGQELSNQKSWPRHVLKGARKPAKAARRKLRDLEESEDTRHSDIMNVFHSTVAVSDIDFDIIVESVLNGTCEDSLAAWTVLNMALKPVPYILEQTSPPHAATDSLSLGMCIALLKRAVKDFQDLSRSTDVVRLRALSQIMRVVEQVWLRARGVPNFAGAVEPMAEFVRACTLIIELKPRSKALLTPAVRVASLALEDRVLGTEDTQALVIAVSKAQLSTAAGFMSEVVMLLTSVENGYTEVLADTSRAWLPSAIRALLSNSPVIRQSVLALIVRANGNNSALPLNEALDTPFELSPRESEPIARTLARRSMGLLSSSDDDVRLVAKLWSMFLEAGIKPLEDFRSWRYLDLWFDVMRAALRSSPSIALSVCWDSLISLRIPELMLQPFVACGLQSHLPFGRMLVEATEAMPKTSELWHGFLETALKTVGQRGEDGRSDALSSWSSALRLGLPLSEDELTSYIEVTGILFRQPTQQTIPLCEQVWRCIAAIVTTRAKALELAKFHYRLLALENYTLSLALTCAITKTWSFRLLTEKPKGATHSLLSLVLLPVVTYAPEDRTAEYLDKAVFTNSRNDEELLGMLRALLEAVEGTSERKIQRWVTAASALRHYATNDVNPESVSLVLDTLITLLTVTSQGALAEPDVEIAAWGEWSNLYDRHLKERGRERLFSRIRQVTSDAGFNAIMLLAADSERMRHEKIRIIVASLDSKRIKMLQGSSLEPSFIDAVARSLLTAHDSASIKWAVDLVTPKRMIVLAKPTIVAILNASRPEALTRMWNSEIVEHLQDCPPFISSNQASQIARDHASLVIPAHLVLTTPGAPVKRSSLETPPPSSKRQRRAILTGSMPSSLSLGLSLSTPPNSSDATEETYDELCSSPPSSLNRSSQDSSLPKWNTSLERARTLKRVIMGLNMEEAMHSMKRSECDMIYNLLFRSCVSLKSHLAATAPPKTASNIEEARLEASKNTQRFNHILEKELEVKDNHLRRVEAELARHREKEAEWRPKEDIDYNDFKVKDESRLGITLSSSRESSPTRSAGRRKRVHGSRKYKADDFNSEIDSDELDDSSDDREDEDDETAEANEFDDDEEPLYQPVRSRRQSVKLEA